MKICGGPLETAQAADLSVKKKDNFDEPVEAFGRNFSVANASGWPLRVPFWRRLFS